MSARHAMERLTHTPFGARPITAALIAQARSAAQARAPLPRVDKWSLLADLTDARRAFGVTERELAVLHALLSFHPARELEDEPSVREDDGDGDTDAPAPLIVFPSNARLSARAHGLPESTLRRRLARLVEAGLIARHDSPNGKRYAARDASGAIRCAFGFDLRPLLLRAAEIAQAAEAAREAAEALRRAREIASLRLRDASKLLAYAQATCPSDQWEALADDLADRRRHLRRRLDAEEVSAEAEGLSEMLVALQSALHEANKLSGNDSRFERHHQSSKPKPSDLEPCQENKGSAAAEAPGAPPPSLPFGLVKRACPQIALYSDRDLRSWDDLVHAASVVRAMMGISPDAWRQALAAMGAPTAATALAAMLERFEEIRSPGGYLRALAAKAAVDAFSPVPMVMALLNRQETAAA
ncbi:MAG: plasmid replication protein RepC [Pseudomonadota bacterium]